MRSKDWTQTGQRAEPAAIHSGTVPYHQKDGDEGCHEETALCRRGRGADIGGVEQAVYQTRAEDGSAVHLGHQREELDIELKGKKLTQGTVSCT